MSKKASRAVTPSKLPSSRWGRHSAESSMIVRFRAPGALELAGELLQHGPADVDRRHPTPLLQEGHRDIPRACPDVKDPGSGRRAAHRGEVTIHDFPVERHRGQDPVVRRGINLPHDLVRPAFPDRVPECSILLQLQNLEIQHYAFEFAHARVNARDLDGAQARNAEGRRMIATAPFDYVHLVESRLPRARG